ncbi:DUF1800 family protein [Akkermansiaceae bacterium]|nr:DUF1800 family protein [Akkermansiaceae bacterium]MDB4498849.1 DUF1800 family protein [Akkermansiaceae bacterium]
MAAIATSSAEIDLNQNLVSDLWELSYPTLPADDTDSDKDGYSNAQEASFGTDPLSAHHFPALSINLNGSGDGVILSWKAVPGKRYWIQRLELASDGVPTWVDVTVIEPGVSSALKTVIQPTSEKKTYRLGVSDVDQDFDGLTASEEFLLGYSDDNPTSSGVNGMSDFVAALRAMEAADGLTLSNGQQVGPRKPSEEEAARFLIQASFGPTSATISEVTTMGYSGWIDSQKEAPTSQLRTTMFRTGASFSSTLARDGLWRAHLVAPDQLRQRVAYALSQIFVVGTEGSSVVGDNPIVQASYYDFFVNGAFEGYRDLLEQVTYSPVMGFYLSHLNNRKGDPEIDRFPDENFAREIMQLFTIGLWELELDGTRRTESDGNSIPTYGNDTITEMAKVFTGMSHTRVNNGQTATSFFDGARGNDYVSPMKVWEDEHDSGAKDIIGPNILPGDGSQTGEEEVQATLDALMDHPNTAPFVSRLLIQRFTSSNPSGAYIQRVAEAWLASDGPDNMGAGNLGRVIEAILLDPEARLAPISDDAHYGKAREPHLRHTHLFRAFGFAREDGRYFSNSNLQIELIGHYPTSASSVFNFYLPDYQPPGELKDLDLVAPELQLFTDAQIITAENRARYAVDDGLHLMKADFSNELALLPDVDAMIDRVELLLTGKRLSENSREAVKIAVLAETSDEKKVKTAVYLITQSPEYSVTRP